MKIQTGKIACFPWTTFYTKLTISSQLKWMSLLIVRTKVNLIILLRLWHNWVLLFHLKNSHLFCFKLPSQGCQSCSILLKQPKNENSTPQQLQVTEEFGRCKKTFYSCKSREERNSKEGEIFKKKAYHAIYVTKDLLGDDLTASFQNEAEATGQVEYHHWKGKDSIVKI